MRKKSNLAGSSSESRFGVRGQSSLPGENHFRVRFLNPVSSGGYTHYRVSVSPVWPYVEGTASDGSTKIGWYHAKASLSQSNFG